MTDEAVPKVTVIKRRAERFTGDRLRALKTAEEVAPAVRLTPERIRYYADANLCPHYRVEKEPLFDEGELLAWVAHNLLHHHDGTRDMRVTVLGGFEKPNRDELPPEIRLMADTLREIPTRHSPGVYFLCHMGSVVYVGQSTRPMSRIVQHELAGKVFDSVYFLACTENELDMVESMMIHALRPPLNGCNEATGEMVAPIPRSALKERA